MSVGPEAVLGVVGGAIVVEEAVNATKAGGAKIAHTVGGVPEHEPPQVVLLRSIDESLNTLVKQATSKGTPDTQFVTTISPVGQTLRALGHKHILMCVLGTPTVTFSVPGLGLYTVALSSGWNIVDFDGAEVTAAAPFNALLRVTDESFGNPI